MKFSVEYLVRFQHCDPAGIVFYPQYFVIFSQLIEDWFAALGCGYPVLHRERGYGIPLVHTEVDFLGASRYGDTLTFELEVEKLGTSSFTLNINARCEDEERVRVKYVLVFVNNDDGNTIDTCPIPEDIRKSMEKYLVT